MDKTVDIPEGVTVVKEAYSLAVSGPKGELRREFRYPKVGFEINGKTITVSTKSDRKKDRAVLGTWASHMRNMIAGVSTGWEASMKIVHSHFPMKVAVEGNTLVVQNFLGERKFRVAKIVGDTKVEVRKDIVVAAGADKEAVGQTCGNIENATRVSGRDKRIFQDGIYIISKCTPPEEGGE